MLLAGILVKLGAIAMIAVSILLIGLVLLQKNRGSGLSGAFGGVGGHSAFGTKTGDFLTWVTVGLTSLFLLLAILLNYGFTPARPAEASTEGTTSAPVTPTPNIPDPAAPVPTPTPRRAPIPAPGAPAGPGTTPMPRPPPSQPPPVGPAPTPAPAPPPGTTGTPTPTPPSNPPPAPTGG